jgi:hypothetical protein
MNEYSWGVILVSPSVTSLALKNEKMSCHISGSVLWASWDHFDFVCTDDCALGSFWTAFEEGGQGTILAVPVKALGGLEAP